MNKILYYRIIVHTLYKEIAWWGIVKLAPETGDGAALLVSDLQQLKIYMVVDKIEDHQKQRDRKEKGFSGKLLYVREVGFPPLESIADLQTRLVEWYQCDSFKDVVHLCSRYEKGLDLERISTRDPWAKLRLFISRKKISESYEEIPPVEKGDEIFEDDSSGVCEPGFNWSEKIS